ncbi:hypothetical protein BDZ89DRAFT_1068292 [Hymenopellis radicata]|nr:hypothetical protein BDZ89DRAFT_1068292 [Hymenopellis radicata]
MIIPSLRFRRRREPSLPSCRASLSLPFELIVEIARFFDRSELKRLRQVNYAWNAAIRPLVLDTVTISAAPLLSEHGCRTPLKRISSPAYSVMVKALRVWVDIDEFPAIFNPVSLAAHEYGMQMGMESRWERRQRSRRAAGKDKAMKAFLKALLVAVPKLVDLRHVELQWGDLDDMDAPPVPANTIVPYLLELPKLTSLVIESYSHLPSVLLSFRNLERLAIICASDLQPLSAIIANNPNLKVLTLAGYDDNTMAPWKLGWPPPPPLDTLFPSESSIESLAISHFLLTELPHPFHSFRNLKSLRLLDSQPRNMSEAFWEGMSREGVSLERLEVTCGTLAIVRYVASYTGLRWFALYRTAYGVDPKTIGHRYGGYLHYGPNVYDKSVLVVVGGHLCSVSRLGAVGDSSHTRSGITEAGG